VTKIDVTVLKKDSCPRAAWAQMKKVPATRVSLIKDREKCSRVLIVTMYAREDG